MAGFLQSATGLLTAANPIVGGLASIGGSLTQGGLFGGGDEADLPVKSTATGTFTGGGLTITKADDTVKIALILAAVLVGLAVWRKRR